MTTRIEEMVEEFTKSIADLPIDDLTRNSIIWVHKQALTTLVSKVEGGERGTVKQILEQELLPENQPSEWHKRNGQWIYGYNEAIVDIKKRLEALQPEVTNKKI